MNHVAETQSGNPERPDLPKHSARAGDYFFEHSDHKPDPSEHRGSIEPWLSALLQAEHLNLLLGSGFTTAIANAADGPNVDFRAVPYSAAYAEAVEGAAKSSASRLGRSQPNFEDQTRVVMELIGGLRILAEGAKDKRARKWAASHFKPWSDQLDKSLSSLFKKILATERGIDEGLTEKPERSGPLRSLLGGFLLPFANRAATRERTHIFTTNYDRLIEYASDLLGLRIIDRFTGTLAPVFRSSRLGVDLHYNPPGIRGEPRYLEGVVRLTKLHGSVDWRSSVGASGRHEVQRAPLPFGAADDHPSAPERASDQLLIYPNAAKDVETLEFPYADLFRDFAAAVCRPNAVVVTYGFGFGDDHVNRVLRDALSIPSTHIVIISYDNADGRLQTFLESAGHEAQITLLRGPHFGDLSTLVKHYLPSPAIDRTTWRMVDLLNRRTPMKSDAQGSEADHAKVNDSKAGGAE